MNTAEKGSYRSDRVVRTIASSLGRQRHQSQRKHHVSAILIFPCHSPLSTLASHIMLLILIDAERLPISFEPYFSTTARDHGSRSDYKGEANQKKCRANGRFRDGIQNNAEDERHPRAVALKVIESASQSSHCSTLCAMLRLKPLSNDRVAEKERK